MPCYNNPYVCNVPTPQATPKLPIINSLAVASVIRQPYNSTTYDVKTAFLRGTIYPDLDKPYLGRGGCH